MNKIKLNKIDLENMSRDVYDEDFKDLSKSEQKGIMRRAITFKRMNETKLKSRYGSLSNFIPRY